MHQNASTSSCRSKLRCQGYPLKTQRHEYHTLHIRESKRSLDVFEACGSAAGRKLHAPPRFRHMSEITARLLSIPTHNFQAQHRQRSSQVVVCGLYAYSHCQNASLDWIPGSLVATARGDRPSFQLSFPVFNFDEARQMQRSSRSLQCLGISVSLCSWPSRWIYMAIDLRHLSV